MCMFCRFLVLCVCFDGNINGPMSLVLRCFQFTEYNVLWRNINVCCVIREQWVLTRTRPYYKYMSVLLKAILCKFLLHLFLKKNA